MRNLVLGLVPYDGIVTGDDTGLDVDGDGFWLLDWGLMESLASLRCRTSSAVNSLIFPINQSKPFGVKALLDLNKYFLFENLESQCFEALNINLGF